MLPPGHIAAGYLVAEVLLKFTHPQLTSAELNQLVCWGMFFGFAPDLDVFWFMIKNRTLRVVSKDASGKSHRNSFTHVPLFWLVLGLAVYFLGATIYWKYFGLLIWLGGWSHMILDSIAFGIPWLSPFSNKFYALTETQEAVDLPEKNIFKYGIHFLKFYSTKATFYLEIVVILSAAIVFFHY
ncbi:MAG TPA: metal-dependent hydrolase [Candidatus Limnocylindria bacterium]|nr:metal-dependent hydrolase [Candidatus Limnocylindria bacterium]